MQIEYLPHYQGHCIGKTKKLVDLNYNIRKELKVSLPVFYHYQRKGI